MCVQRTCLYLFLPLFLLHVNNISKIIKTFCSIVALNIPFSKKKFDQIDQFLCFHRFNVNDDIDILFRVCTDTTNFSHSINRVYCIIKHLFRTLSIFDLLFQSINL